MLNSFCSSHSRIGATTIMLLVWKKIKIFRNFISLIMNASRRLVMRVYFIRHFHRAWSLRNLNNKLYASITNIIYITMSISLIWFGLKTTGRHSVEIYAYSLQVEHILVGLFNVLVNRTFFPAQPYRKILIHLNKNYARPFFMRFHIG